VFDHSWSLLSAAESTALMRLSVFRGGFDLESAQEVAGASLPILVGLVDKSLVRLNPSGRYDMQELLRQYTAGQLAASGQEEGAVECHLSYFLSLAEQMEQHLYGPDQIAWFDRIEVEHDNMRAALENALQRNNAETGLRLAAALGWFWALRGHW